MADPKVNPCKVWGRMHLRVDGTTNKLGLRIHEGEEVPCVMERIPVQWESLRGDASGLEILQREVLDDSILRLNPIPVLRTQKKMNSDAGRLELVEQCNVAIRGLVNRTVFVQVDQRTDVGRLHIAVLHSVSVSI